MDAEVILAWPKLSRQTRRRMPETGNRTITGAADPNFSAGFILGQISALLEPRLAQLSRENQDIRTAIRDELRGSIAGIQASIDAISESVGLLKTQMDSLEARVGPNYAPTLLSQPVPTHREPLASEHSPRIRQMTQSTPIHSTTGSDYSHSTQECRNQNSPHQPVSSQSTPNPPQSQPTPNRQSPAHPTPMHPTRRLSITEQRLRTQPFAREYPRVGRPPETSVDSGGSFRDQSRTERLHDLEICIDTFRRRIKNVSLIRAVITGIVNLMADLDGAPLPSYSQPIGPWWWPRKIPWKRVRQLTAAEQTAVSCAALLHPHITTQPVIETARKALADDHINDQTLPILGVALETAEEMRHIGLGPDLVS